MALLRDPLLSEFISITKLLEIVIYVAKTTSNFKPQLGQLENTLGRIIPVIQDIVNLNRKHDRTEVETLIFIEEIQQAEKLVRQCLKIKRKFIKKSTHSLKLKDVNNKLLQFFRLEVQVNDVAKKRDSLSMNFRKMLQTLSCNSMSIVYGREQVGQYELDRGKLGWRVPGLPTGIVGFDEPLKKLKDKILADDDDGGCSMDTDDGFDYGSVVVVAAAVGCGKTTLVAKLCYDPEIRDKFEEKVFYVHVPETPNFMVIVNDLINPNSFGQPIPFQSDEDAKDKLGNFLREKISSPMLLVLDDVWCDSFIDNFPSKIKGCKILVTSRTAFPKYDVFKLDPLSDEDAKTLFQRSAFTESKERPRAIDGGLVNQMVECCKGHPLALTAFGHSLHGRDEPAWKSQIRSLDLDTSFDMNEPVHIQLERNFMRLDEEFKECFLDFGLFPEDQRIPASALLDMWVHLYNHDDKGNDTFDKIIGLSYRYLVNPMATGLRKGTLNHCDRQFVKQHELMRKTAIDLSSKAEVPIPHRKRLIINARGEDLPASIIQVQETMQARILSISTGESFSSRWCNMKVPNVEVMVLNLMSKTYTLPHFLMGMQKMKVLNVTNYGLYPTHIEDFVLIGCLSNLLRIRLERVSISSLSISILALVNLQKVSFIMCKIGNAFENLNNNNFEVWPRLVEIEMDHCPDLVEFPAILCKSVHLKTLSITNCNEMYVLPNEFGNLTSLETLSLRSCTKLANLPESITRLEKLNIIDISGCFNLEALPEEMGNLSGLRTIYMKGCTGIHELPSSVEELYDTKVVCNEEISYKWREYDNVKIDLVEENRKTTRVEYEAVSTITIPTHQYQDLEKFRIPLEEIEVAIGETKRIGDGGFGIVYKGQLSERWQNRTAAMKKHDPKGYQGKDEFRNELAMLSRFHHQNIIRFIGYYDGGDHMIIVSEYATNGSLDCYLLDLEKRSSLTWIQRLEICLGAAKGLNYLHSGLGDDNRVIHRDIKSANILLDDNLEAKICDFGLSKSGPRNQPKTQIYTNVAGTHFYMDPIYGESGILHKESDVYSFGVVLFEMLSGMLAYYRRKIGTDKPATLISLVRRLYDEGLDELIDPVMKDQLYPRSFDKFKEIAYDCISYNIKERPTMETVIKRIEEALNYQLSQTRRN